jgi:hypothetical protein
MPIFIKKGLKIESVLEDTLRTGAFIIKTKCIWLFIEIDPI